MEKLVLSINEAAALLSVSPWTVRKWVRQGKIRPTRLGRRVLVSPDALRKLVSQGTPSGILIREPEVSERK